jgi:protein transport protein HofB
MTKEPAMAMADSAIRALCQRYRAVLLHHDATLLRVAVAEQVPEGLSEALSFASQCQVEVECWPLARLELHQHGSAATDAPRDALPESAIEAVNQMLQQALRRRASDIHIEPQRDGVRIRLRIDGVLQPLTLLSEAPPAALLARLKILGGLDIAERRLPQDGQFTLTLEGKPAAFRLATLPVCSTVKKRSFVCCKARIAPWRWISSACPLRSGVCWMPRWRSRRG